MATAILDQILKSQFGKSLIMWFFLAMCGAIVALAGHSINQSSELKQCNESRIEDNRRNDQEKAAMTMERITELQTIINRLEAVEKKRKR